MQKTCANCGAENPVTAKFCRRCGRPCTEQVIRSVTKPSPVMQQWRQLSHNLTRKEVRKALGEPIRVETGEPAGASTAEIWIYEYEVVNRGAGPASPTAGGTPTPPSEERVSGTVKLSVLEGRVLSWVEPDWHRLSN